MRNFALFLDYWEWQLQPAISDAYDASCFGLVNVKIM